MVIRIGVFDPKFSPHNHPHSVSYVSSKCTSTECFVNVPHWHECVVAEYEHLKHPAGGAAGDGHDLKRLTQLNAAGIFSRFVLLYPVLAVRMHTTYTSVFVAVTT